MVTFNCLANFKFRTRWKTRQISRKLKKMLAKMWPIRANHCILIFSELWLDHFSVYYTLSVEPSVLLLLRDHSQNTYAFRERGVSNLCSDPKNQYIPSDRLKYACQSPQWWLPSFFHIVLLFSETNRKQ